MQKKWSFINVFWDKHYDIFQMYLITIHLDKSPLTTTGKFLSTSLQVLVSSSLPEFLKTSYFLLTIRQCVFKFLGWNWFKKKKKERAYNFDVLKNLSVMVIRLW